MQNRRQYESIEQGKQSSFHPLEVVGRGSETQLQVGEDLKRVVYVSVALEKGHGMYGVTPLLVFCRLSMSGGNSLGMPRTPQRVSGGIPYQNSSTPNHPHPHVINVYH